MRRRSIRETSRRRKSPRRPLTPRSPALLLLLFLPPIALAQTPDGPLRVNGPRVVFFSPSRTERDSLARGEGLEIDDVMDDFNFYAAKTAVFLSHRGIPAEFSETETFIVKVGTVTFRTFDRRSIPDPVGMILTDGVHEPRVVPGRGTERDLILEIKEYFHLKEESEE